MDIHTVNFCKSTWLCIDDLAKFIGYTPYILKCPTNSIEIKMTREIIETRCAQADDNDKPEFMRWLKGEIIEHPKVYYIDKPEFMCWLKGEIEYKDISKIDATLEKLYDQLK